MNIYVSGETNVWLPSILIGEEIRVGDDPNCNYCGGTVLLDFLGKPLADAGTGGQPATLSAEADKISLTTFREKFPALQDADPFTLNI